MAPLMKGPLGRRVLVAFSLLFSFGWPVLHMALSSSRGFSSWKMGGWGMYSTPSPEETFIRIYLLEPGAVLPSGPLPLFGSNKRVGCGALRVSADGQVTPAIDSPKHLCDPTLTYRSPASLQPLLRHHREKDPLARSSDRQVVFITTPRINLSERYAYLSTVAYLFETGGSRLLGEYFSDQKSSDAMSGELNATLGQP